MMTLFELKGDARKYRDGKLGESAFRDALKRFAADYSTHAELDRLAELLAGNDRT